MAISKVQRELVAQRADDQCEYCRMHQDHAVKNHEPDHIIPLKHGGNDSDENLAWACFQCNRYKGSEVGAYDSHTGHLVTLFNPRQHSWHEHFSIEAGEIVAHTDIGRVTILVLQLNRPNRVEVRQLLMHAGLYP
jgi:hypothetical protein